ncbi:MAG: SCP2 sterol-binding domain-containing protein [Promethearchaeati archaeon]
MGVAKENLEKIIEKVNQNQKARNVFVTNLAGKDVNWDMSFQFKLDQEDPFYLEISDRMGKIHDGQAKDPDIILTGDNEAIVRICNGEGDFTHAISREQITVEKGKVMEVVRLTRAITTALR